MDDARHLEFDHTLDDHHPFIGGVHIALPALTRRVHPQIAGEPALLPVLSHRFDIHRYLPVQALARRPPPAAPAISGACPVPAGPMPK